MKFMQNTLCSIGVTLLTALLPALLWAYEGRVYNSQSNTPIPGATVTLSNQVVYTDPNGQFQIEGPGTVASLRAPGYRRRNVSVDQLTASESTVFLTPLTVKGLYLSVYGIGSTKLREKALATLKQNNMNTLVIDVKGDRGFIPFKTNFPTAHEIGAQKIITIRDMQGLMEGLQQDDIYLIARIVVFKDDLLARARPEWAVKTVSGIPYLDHEYSQWVDPFVPGVWEHNIAIAKIAAEAGFDEIQLDYVRFPDKRGLIFSQPASETSRTEAITDFLQAAQQALIPYNVMLAADVFGYVLWNSNDTDIGQKLAPILDSVDIVSPMLYPSGFQFGIPKYKNPVSHPFEVVYISLKRAQERTSASPLRFRPWLQAFRDYAFDRVDFGDEKIREQVRAAEAFGSSGWMLWNPRNIYPQLQGMDKPQYDTQ